MIVIYVLFVKIRGLRWNFWEKNFLGIVPMGIVPIFLDETFVWAYTFISILIGHRN